MDLGPQTTDAGPVVGRLQLPSPRAVDYWQKLLTMVALLLGLPIVIYMAIRRPEHLAARVLQR
jgi:hypothetical protein